MASRERCSAILPPSFISGRKKESQCRKRATGTMETRTGFTVVHPVCDSEECANWIFSGKSVKWL